MTWKSLEHLAFCTEYSGTPGRGSLKPIQLRQSEENWDEWDPSQCIVHYEIQGFFRLAVI